ncbi:MAG: hypothetical protein WBQ73_03105 [Candidatus Babeliales bacterium]
MDMQEKLKHFTYLFIGLVIFFWAVGTLLFRLIFAVVGLYFIAKGLEIRRSSDWYVVVRRWFY